jgi:hypothetical protein
VLVLALASVFVVSVIHVLMVVRLLDYVTLQYNDTYGLPLVASEAVVADVARFAARDNARAAAVEYDGPESGAMAYLIRPLFPVLELAKVGQVGLGAAVARSPVAERAATPMSVLGAVQYPDLRYPDGVRVVDAVTSIQWTPGKRIRLVLTWESLRSAPVTWEVVVYDTHGTSLAVQRGPSHAGDLVRPGEPVVSLFSVPTETGVPPQPVRLGLRRVDGEPDEWLSMPIEPVQP